MSMMSHRVRLMPYSSTFSILALEVHLNNLFFSISIEPFSVSLNSRLCDLD